MLQIDHTVISLDVVESNFVCDLSKCKGACCVAGDSGAPVKEDEALVLKEIFNDLRDFLRPEGIKAIEEQGTSIVDDDGDLVTPLVNHQECAYAIFENGIAKCGIEKAWEAGRVSFRKPVSCHMYPIRVTKYNGFEALNYHRWDVCKPAVQNGNQLKVPIFRFLEQPLKREYGEKWYRELEIASTELAKFYRKNKE